MITYKHSTDPKRVSKIAIVNPYLQGGHVNIAESETANRFKQAGKKLGVDIQIFAKGEEVIEFHPDFVINITYQEGKLTQFPTYVSLNIPLFFIENVPRFVRNILSCDGFMTVSTQMTDWLKQLCVKHHKIPHIAYTAFSVPQTEFVKCDFKNGVAVYIGTNWDGCRHSEVFHSLSNGKYLKCFGPAKSWSQYPASLYGGSVPFDGVSLFEIYRKNALGFCIGHPRFDEANVANTRIFEIAAASALPISSDNTFTKSIYGDSILYLDAFENPKLYAEQVISMVSWAKSNPEIAQEMAYEAHQLFNQHASMEFYLTNLIEMHYEVMKTNRFAKDIDVENTTPTPAAKSLDNKVVYIVQSNDLASLKKVLLDLSLQTYANIEIIFITDHQSKILEYVKTIPHFSVNQLHFISNSKNDLFQLLTNIHASWISIVSDKDQLFRNHTAFLIDACERYKDNLQNTEISAIYSKCLEYSNDVVLNDYIEDDHTISTHNKVRISENARKLLMKFSNMDSKIFQEIKLCGSESKKLYAYLKKYGAIISVPEVTCATLLINQK